MPPNDYVIAVGIGSGVCIRHGDYQDINLITLYTSTRYTDMLHGVCTYHFTSSKLALYKHIELA